MRFNEFRLDEIKKGAKDSNGFSSCWTGYHAAGTKKGKNGGQVRNCVKNEDINETSHVNGRIEDPKSLRWKQTGLSYEQAVAKYGKENVKDEGKNRHGHSIIYVHVPLGEGAGATAVAIAKKESGKYNKTTGKRLKEGSLADAAKHVKKGALHKQEGIPKDKKIGTSKLKSLKAHGTPLEKKRANFALNIQGKS